MMSSGTCPWLHPTAYEQFEASMKTSNIPTENSALAVPQYVRVRFLVEAFWDMHFSS